MKMENKEKVILKVVDIGNGIRTDILKDVGFTELGIAFMGIVDAVKDSTDSSAIITFLSTSIAKSLNEKEIFRLFLGINEAKRLIESIDNNGIDEDEDDEYVGKEFSYKA